MKKHILLSLIVLLSGCGEVSVDVETSKAEPQRTGCNSNDDCKEEGFPYCLNRWCVQCTDSLDCADSMQCVEHVCKEVVGPEQPKECESGYEVSCSGGYYHLVCSQGNSTLISLTQCSDGDGASHPVCGDGKVTADCDKDKTSVVFKCEGSNLSAGIEPILCSDGICNNGVCVFKQSLKCEDYCNGECDKDGICHYACTNDNCNGKCVNNVCKPLVVSDCGEQQDGSFRICDLEDLHTYRELKTRSSIHKLIFHGLIMCNELCENIPSDNLESIMGEDAVITSYLPLTHPLFADLKDGVSISDLTLNTDLEFSNSEKGARGILANQGTNVNVHRIIVKGVELSASGQLNRAGVLFGHVSGGTFDQIELSDVHISMGEDSNYKYDCNKIAQYSSDIGGIVGLADGTVTITEPVIQDMTISARGAARVGGLIGHAHGVVAISGRYKESKESGYDISGITIQYAERDAGGLIGRIGEAVDGASNEIKATINNIKSSIRKVDTRLQCAGGVVGAAYYGDVVFKDMVLDVKTVDASGFAGGVMGKVYKTNYVTLSNIEIKSNNISAHNYEDCDNDSQSSFDKEESNGNKVGGMIGAIGSTKLTLENVKNLFHSLDVNSIAGGIIGHGYGVNLTIHDLINRSYADSKELSIRASANAGGLIGSINVSEMDMTNVISDNIQIKTTGKGNAAGLVAFISFTNNSNTMHMTHVISNAKIEAQSNAAGFMFVLKLIGEKSKVVFDHILSKSEVVSSDGSVAGFIDHLDIAQYDKLCSYHSDGPDYWVCNDVLQITNVLVESDLVKGGNRVGSGNVLRDIYLADLSKYLQSGTCASTNRDSYGVQYPRCDGVGCKDIDDKVEISGTYKIWSGFSKTAIRKIFNNVYYSTPGFFKPDFKYDNWEITLNALNWCGDQSDNTNENRSNAKGNSGKECVYHRNYKQPVYSCWFTDYIYHKDFTYKNKVVNNIDQINGEDIPIKPYHPYFAKITENKGAYTIDETSVNEVINNKDKVLDALSSSEHKWSECSKLKFTKDNGVSFDINRYGNLLCPVLAGAKYTAMTAE